MVDHKALIEKMGRALNDNDAALLAEIYADDIVEEYPQSGEVFRGRGNIAAMLDNYPGRKETGMLLGDIGTLKVKPADGFKVAAPSFTVVRVEGAGDSGVYTVRAHYPDDSYWWVVSIYKLRGSQIIQSRTFFAPDFPAPEWRKPFVEPMK